MIEFVKSIIIAGGVWLWICRLGFFLDDKIDNKLREHVSQLLRDSNRIRWPELFISLFDSVFCPERSDRPLFWRSALASCVALFAVTIIFLVTQVARDGSILDGVNRFPWQLLIFLGPYVVFVNVIGDYFSLWESRFVIAMMIRRKSLRTRIFLLVFDAIASAFIFSLGVVLGTASFLGIWVLFGGSLSFGGHGSWTDHLLSETGGILSSLVFDGGLLFSDPESIGNFFGILLYTTFFTSVWVWVFLAGMTLLPTFIRFWGVFKVEKYPVGAAMCTGGAAVGLVVFVLMLSGIC